MPTMPELRILARRAIDQALGRLAEYSGLTLPPIQLDFSLKGRCAGQAGIKGRQLLLRINLPVLAGHLEDYLATTIPHEVAHLQILWLYRGQRRRPRPHGPEWQAVMQECFGLEPRRCHDYQTTPARIFARNFRYRCGCREHRLTSIMHNRIGKGAVMVCRLCRQPLSTCSPTC